MFLCGTNDTNVQWELHVNNITAKSLGVDVLLRLDNECRNGVCILIYSTLFQSYCPF